VRLYITAVLCGCCNVYADISYVTFSKASEAALAIEETNGKLLFDNPRPVKVFKKINYFTNAVLLSVLCIVRFSSIMMTRRALQAVLKVRCIVNGTL